MKLLHLHLRRLSGLMVACVLAQVLAACAPLPVALPPAVAVPESFRELAPAGADTLTAAELPDGGWWRVFGDAQLDAWVERARSGNPGLQQAAARVARAVAVVGTAVAEAEPRITAGMGASRQVGPLVNAAGHQGNLFSADLRLRHDLDLLHKLSRAQQAALHDLQAQQALHRQAQLVLESEVALTYLAWCAVQAEVELHAQVLALDRTLLALAERRVAAGLAAASARSAPQAELLADEVQTQELERRRALLEHALAVLAGDTGQSPAPARATLAELPRIPPGLPSRMLQRRADVAAAEQALQAARVRLGLARDAWFPDLTLTASAGLASSELGQWLRAGARSTGLGLLLGLPVFDGGRADAERAAAVALLDQATAEHRDKVVQALREVDDQLATLRTLGAEADVQRRAAELLQADSRRAEGQWRRGMTSEAEARQAQRQSLRQQRLGLQVQARQRAATVALVRALGGGWGDALPAMQVAGH